MKTLIILVSVFCAVTQIGAMERNRKLKESSTSSSSGSYSSEESECITEADRKMMHDSFIKVQALMDLDTFATQLNATIKKKVKYTKEQCHIYSSALQAIARCAITAHPEKQSSHVCISDYKDDNKLYSVPVATLAMLISDDSDFSSELEQIAHYDNAQNVQPFFDQSKKSEQIKYIFAQENLRYFHPDKLKKISKSTQQAQSNLSKLSDKEISKKWHDLCQKKIDRYVCYIPKLQNEENLTKRMQILKTTYTKHAKFMELYLQAIRDNRTRKIVAKCKKFNKIQTEYLVVPTILTLLENTEQKTPKLFNNPQY